MTEQQGKEIGRSALKMRLAHSRWSHPMGPFLLFRPFAPRVEGS